MSSVIIERGERHRADRPKVEHHMMIEADWSRARREAWESLSELPKRNHSC